MVALIFNAPPIDHGAVELGDNEWITSDGEILEWRAMGLWHLMGAYKTMRETPEAKHDEYDLADLKRYIEYRTSIGNVHGD
jgi:hypothetical protein